MLKREAVWRRIADEAIVAHRGSFHQSDLAAELGMSVGNVNLALAPLRAIGAVDVVGKRLVVRDLRKILYLWGSRRAPEAVLAAFDSVEPANRTIPLLPPGIALTSFAGFVARYRSEPAPFSVIRGYVAPGDAAVLAELGRRFLPAIAPDRATIVIHAADAGLAADLPEVVGPAQLWVDLWSESDFFAADYLRNLEAELRI